MEIYRVPDKSNLVYLDAQYFHNTKADGTTQKGVTQHVIKIQYRSKRGTMKNFIIPLSTIPKEINRKARKKLTAEDAQTVVDIAKVLKAKGEAFGFGFRQITITERTDKGGRLFHKEQDTNVSAWAFFEETGIRVQLLWGHDIMEVMINPHKELKHDKQSMGIGYWNRTAELEQAIKGKNNDNKNTGPNLGEACEAGGEGTRGSESQQLAGLEGQREASDLGGIDSQGLVDNPEQGKVKQGHAVQISHRQPASSSYQPTVKGNKRKGLDRPEFGAWQPADVSPTHDGLGTSIRIPTSV